jgi:hypothetical protein
MPRAVSFKALNSAAVAEMLLDIVIANGLRTYNRDRSRRGRSKPDNHVGIVLDEMFSVMPVRVNDATDNRPLSINAISRRTTLPPESTRRALGHLVRKGSLLRSGRGFISNVNYIEQIDLAVFMNVARAVAKCHERLEALQSMLPPL